MDENCVFCKIIKGEIQTHKIFEDDKTLAFLDANPLARGHTIIIPKSHVMRVEDLEWREAEKLFENLHYLIPKVKGAVEAPSTTIGINNGPESGQEIPHVHVHIIPRFKRDGGGPIHTVMKRKSHRISGEDMKEIAQEIRKIL